MPLAGMREAGAACHVGLQGSLVPTAETITRPSMGDVPTGTGDNQDTKRGLS